MNVRFGCRVVPCVPASFVVRMILNSADGPSSGTSFRLHVSCGAVSWVETVVVNMINESHLET